MAERYDYEDAEVQAPVTPARVERQPERDEAPPVFSSPPVRATPSVGKNPIMAEMGTSGGHARTVALTPERRREIARLGGLARARGKG